MEPVCLYTGNKKTYYENGSLKTLETYFKGRKNGLYIYYINNKISIRGTYQDDKEIGTWWFYDNDGNIEKQEIYFEDKLTQKILIGNNIFYTLEFMKDGSTCNIIKKDYLKNCLSEYDKYLSKNKYFFKPINEYFIVIIEANSNVLVNKSLTDNSYYLFSGEIVLIFNQFNPKETFDNTIFKIQNTHHNNCYYDMEKAFYYNLKNKHIWKYIIGYKEWDDKDNLIIEIKN